MSFIIAYVTHPDRQTAEAISRKLLDRRLIACANIFPIQSAYWWQQQIEQGNEQVSLLKTSMGRWDDLVAAVRDLHPYDVPCIIKFEVQANPEYEAWIEESVGVVSSGQ